MSWIWQGRQLEGASKNGTSLSYTYDSDGIRTSKTVGSTTTKYLLNGTQILAQTTNGKTLCFFYDQQGNRVAMADSGNHVYYYLYNLQGDVIALADGQTGKLAATYTYDSWGKCTVTNATGFTIGTENPFRYRGYYYDSETGLYYLQSRYYDAETGRFINADAFATTDITTPLSTNMFAYCENNPVMREDPTGELFASLVGGALLGGAINVAMTVILSGGDVSAGAVAGAFLSGAISGTLMFSCAGKAASVAVNAAANTIGYISECVIDGKEITFGGVATAVASGVTTGCISGGGVYSNQKVANAAKEYDSLVYNVKTKVDAKKFSDSAMKLQNAVKSETKKSIRKSTFGSLMGNAFSKVVNLFGGRS